MRRLYLLFGLIFFSSCFDCNKHYNEFFRPFEIDGIVDTTFLDKRYHLSETILLKNQSEKKLEGVKNILGLYDAVEKGDSIYKAKGSMAVYLYKPDTTLVFYPVCNGDTLK